VFLFSIGLEAPGEFAITNATDTFLKVSWKKSKRAKYYITVLNELVAGDSVVSSKQVFFQIISVH